MRSAGERSIGDPAEILSASRPAWRIFEPAGGVNGTYGQMRKLPCDAEVYGVWPKVPPVFARKLPVRL